MQTFKLKYAHYDNIQKILFSILVYSGNHAVRATTTKLV